MLNVFIGSMEDAKHSGDGWFDNQLDPACLLTDFSKRVIREIDSSTIIDRNLIQSDVLGPIPPAYLSGGSKTLICIMYTDWVFYLTAMGRNCYPFLAEIASQKNAIVCMEDVIDLFTFADFGQIKILNDNSIVKTNMEIINKYDEIEEEEMVNDGQVSY